MTRNVATIFRQVIRCQEGAVITLWAAGLAVFMGLLALTFDFGRLSATQSELQAFADNVALAAAGELDGAEDAIDRARSAAEDMIIDTQTFGDGSRTLQGPDDYTLTFHTENPVGDGTDSLTTDGTDARFVRVDVTSRTVQAVFSAAFAALTSSQDMTSSVGAEAVAGMSMMACGITPMMFCAPSADFRADENVGMSVLLRGGGGKGGRWGPGAFGFLDPSAGELDPDGVCGGLSGAMLDICLIAAVGDRPGCVSSTGVTIAPGQRVGNFEAGLNVRFDLFHGAASQLRYNPDYAPAPHVLTGYVSKKAEKGGGQQGLCLGNNVDPSPDTMGFPPDDCHLNGKCDRFGDGSWSKGRADYIAMNYGGVDPHPSAQTRYAYYLAEIAAAGGGASTIPIIPGASETGRPQCSPHQSTDPGRRVAVAAAIDCEANKIAGAKSNVPVQEFVEVFMISPIGLDKSKDFWVEIVGSAGGGGNSSTSEAVFRDIVRLYR